VFRRDETYTGLYHLREDNGTFVGVVFV